MADFRLDTGVELRALNLLEGRFPFPQSCTYANGDSVSSSLMAIGLTS